MFSSLGIHNLPKPTCSGLLIVVGSGRGVWDDLSETPKGDIMAVNDIGMHLPYPLAHWYSNDDKMLPHWIRARRPRYVIDYPSNMRTHTCGEGPEGIEKWPWPGGGTSGLGAVFTGLALGYEQIIICGMPLDNGPHYFDSPHTKTNFGNQVPGDRPRFWTHARDNIFQGRVKSMSGRTKKLLNP